MLIKVQVTKTQISRSYVTIEARTMQEAHKKILKKLDNGDYNPPKWIFQPIVYEVMPLVS
jgi:hypothetical protein